MVPACVAQFDCGPNPTRCSLTQMTRANRSSSRARAHRGPKLENFTKKPRPGISPGKLEEKLRKKPSAEIHSAEGGKVTKLVGVKLTERQRARRSRSHTHALSDYFLEALRRCPNGFEDLLGTDVEDAPPLLFAAGGDPATGVAAVAVVFLNHDIDAASALRRIFARDLITSSFLARSSSSESESVTSRILPKISWFLPVDSTAARRAVASLRRSASLAFSAFRKVRTAPVGECKSAGPVIGLLLPPAAGPRQPPGPGLSAHPGRSPAPCPSAPASVPPSSCHHLAGATTAAFRASPAPSSACLIGPPPDHRARSATAAWTDPGPPGAAGRSAPRRALPAADLRSPHRRRRIRPARQRQHFRRRRISPAPSIDPWAPHPLGRPAASEPAPPLRPSGASSAATAGAGAAPRGSTAAARRGISPAAFASDPGSGTSLPHTRSRRGRPRPARAMPRNFS